MREFNIIDSATEELIKKTLRKELSAPAYGEVLAGSNRYYTITPAIRFNVAGDPYATYAVVNNTTGIAEVDSRQYEAAKGWVRALTSIIESVDDDDADSLAKLLESAIPTSTSLQ